MRILLIHNRYLLKGGEDVSLEVERKLLQEAGHHVNMLFFDNAHLVQLPLWRRLLAPLYNGRAVQATKNEIKHFAPDVVHIHNMFYYASPAIILAVRKANIPLVMTLHNYRLVCVGALLNRRNKPCERCIRKQIPIWGVVYGCFQQSRIKSLLLQLSLLFHNWYGTFFYVDKYLVFSEFAKERFVGGTLRLPADRFIVKASSTASQHYVEPHTRNNRFLYVGRLSTEKGIPFLLRLLNEEKIHIDIIGAGPLAPDVTKVAAAHPQRIRYHGSQTPNYLQQYMRTCRAMLLPSVCYEGLPNVLMEAYAYGTPLLSSDNPSLRHLVLPEQSGLLCPPEDTNSWKAALQRISHDHALHAHLCQGAYAQYTQKFTSQRNTSHLLHTYKTVVQAKQARINT